KVLKGMKLVIGNVLADEHSFTFTTPPPTMQSYWPSYGPTKLDVPMFILFDQQVDAAAVLAKIEVRGGQKKYAVRMLDAAEIDKDATIKSYVESAKSAGQDGRW